MKIWLTKNSEVPVRAQIVAQVRIAIASGDLRPGDKLPSTREMARRFGIHANTASAAYRELANGGVVEMRKGSGIYVGESRTDVLDSLIEKLFSDSEAAGYARSEVMQRILARNGKDRIDRVALFEPDADLRNILAHEIRQATGLYVETSDEADLDANDLLLTAMFDEEPKIRDRIGERPCVFLKANSVASVLVGRTRPADDEIVAIASAWADFVSLGRLFLLAAKIDGRSLVVCSSNEAGWKRRLKAASLIICDAVTAAKLDGDPRIACFSVISPGSIEELRRAAGR